MMTANKYNLEYFAFDMSTQNLLNKRYKQFHYLIHPSLKHVFKILNILALNMIFHSDFQSFILPRRNMCVVTDVLVKMHFIYILFGRLSILHQKFLIGVRRIFVFSVFFNTVPFLIYEDTTRGGLIFVFFIGIFVIAK